MEPVGKATTAQFSTGTWADQFLNAAPLPKEYTDLTEEQQGRVQKILPQVVNDPNNAVIFTAKDGTDAVNVLSIAIGVVKENKDTKQ